MPSRYLLGLLALLEVSGAYVQLDFQKQRVSLSQLHPAIRSRYLQRRANGSVMAQLENAQNNLLYLVDVSVGTPPQNLRLQLDTGSSDIWLPYTRLDVCTDPDFPDLCSDGTYDPRSSDSFDLVSTGDFDIAYVDNTEIQGDYFEDTFGIGGANVTGQRMGLARQVSINPATTVFQGIIGVGYPNGESIVAQGGREYPNIISRLKSENFTQTLAYSLWLNDLQASTGSILFGGVDTSRYEGDLVVLPVQPDEQSQDLSSFTVVFDNLEVVSGRGSQYSAKDLALPVVLDSGTSLTYLPEEISNAIADGVGAESTRSGGLFVPCDLQNTAATINFGFGNSRGPVIKVDVSEFVLPLNDEEQGEEAPTLPDGTIICQWGIRASGDGTPNLFGDTFLRSAYVVYDIENNNIGIAQTTFNVSSSDTDIQEITGDTIPGASSTATGAVVTQTFTGNPNDPTDISEGTSSLDIGGVGTATFDLSGSQTAGASRSQSSNGASVGSTAPSYPAVYFWTAFVAAISGISGAMMVIL